MIERFRTLPLKEKPVNVDRENRVIYGVSCAQAVEAIGHGMLLDSKSIAQLVAQGNASKGGIKSRFTHPGLSSDGLGKYLGRLKDFRQENDKAIADLHFSPLASKAPDGDLAGYVMELAETEPEAFGMSVVIDTERVWPLVDGTERTWAGEREKPKDALTDKPVARVTQFVACDAVDEPAANRDGLFSSALWATNQLAESAFGDIDQCLADLGMNPDKAFEFALKYFNARGVKLKEFRTMDEQQGVLLQTASPDVSALQTQMDELKAQLDAERKAKADELATANERIAKMEKDARSARFRALTAEWFGDPTSHVAALEALGEGSELSKFYVQLNNAHAEQLRQSGLMGDVGTSRSDEGQSASDKLATIAKQLQVADSKLTYAQAVVKAAELNPALYAEHRKGN